MNSSIKKEEHNVEFQTTNEEGEENIEIYDLNKIFQFSYNFEILKNLIEALIKNQQKIQKELKEKHSKILDLETQLIDLKVILDSSSRGKGSNKLEIKSDNQSVQKIDSNPKLFSVIKGNEDILRSPPNDMKLEVSIGNDDNINQIIVSYYVIFLYFIFRKKLIL